LLCGGLTACNQTSTEKFAIETVQAKTWHETLEIDGEIQTADKTFLNVPGQGWQSRVLKQMVADGSFVKQGEVIAKFDAPSSRIELSQAELELLRKALGERAIEAQETNNQATLVADQARVTGDLSISERYAKADTSIFSRNQILDATQDAEFLKAKQIYLKWKSAQLKNRSAADRAVLASQKQTVEQSANQKRSDLAALNLIAPHDGFFTLNANWDGQKPKVGASMRPQDEFGTIPDLQKLTAKFQN